MNQQTLIITGHATAEAVSKTAKNGKEFLVFSVGVNSFRGKDLGSVASFYDVLCFSKSTISSAKKLQKGELLTVIGEPGVSAYQSKSGELKGKITITADYLKHLAESKNSALNKDANSEDFESEEF